MFKKYCAKAGSLEPDDRGFSLLMLGAGLCFYLFYALWDGVVIAVDSESYIAMESSREPVYPMLLAAFRMLYAGLASAAEDAYLQAVVLLQSILAAFAAWCLARYLQKELRLPKLVTLTVYAMPFVVSLLCRFMAGRSSMYSNSILTEGLCIPLYLIFFRYLVEYVVHRTRRSCVWCLVLSFLLYSTRKQMLIALALWMLCTLVLETTGHSRGMLEDASGEEKERTAAGHKRGAAGRFVYGLASALAGALLVMGCSTGLDLGYNYVVRGEWTTHTSDTRFVTTMTFYTADREDAQYIGDEELRELFLEIYDVCDEQGYLMNSAGEGWLARVTHFGDHYDNIQIDTMWPMINLYVSDTYGGSNLDINLGADDIMDVFNAAVLPHNLGKLLLCFADNFLSGLVTTVAQRKSVLIVYSAVIYAVYLATLAACLYAGRGSGGRKADKTGDGGPRKGSSSAGMSETGAAGDIRAVSITAVLTALSILANVGVVSLVIFAQTRYTIYNMPLFYISLILMAYSLWKVRR